MLHWYKNYGRALFLGNAFCRGLLAFIVLGLTPLTAWSAQSCNPDLRFTINTPGPYFLGDTLRISANLGAGNIAEGSWQDIYAFGYALNCHARQDFATCTSEGNVVEFLGNLSTNCKRPDGSDVVLQFPESNVIPITTSDGPIRTGANEQCNVQFDFRVLELNGIDNQVIQAMGWPIDGAPATVCSNGLTSRASSTLAFRIAECGIDLEKQVSVDGQNWFDADTAGSAPSLNLGGTAYYRLIVRNTGSVDYAARVLVVDNALGIDTTIPALAAGDEVILTGDQISALTAVGRCQVVGSLQNVSSVEAACRTGESPVGASAQDSAYVVCSDVLSPSIDIEKATNGQDADNPTGPQIPVGDPVTWTYVVTNTGNTALSNVAVSDDQGVAVSCPKTTLAAGESMVCTANGIAVAGQYANVGTVTADPPAGPAVSDTDPSHYFGTGSQSIAIKKEISVDGGATWHDANDVGSAAVAVYPSDALYRFTVTNNGSAPLKNVVVNDAVLGVTNYLIGDMAIGAEVVLTSGQIPELAVTDRCTARGTFTNTATAAGQSAETDAPTDDSDTAVLQCIGEPHITIKKEISPTGTDPWYDDETPAQQFPSDAYYRITVTNDGTTPLVNVIVEDGDLLLYKEIGSLAVGETVVLAHGEYPELYVTDRCDGAGEVGNTAIASGDSQDDPNDDVTDSDSASLICVGSPAIAIKKEVSVDNVNWFDANSEGEAVVALAPADAWYRVTISNLGGVDLVNVVLNDGALGIVDHVVGAIAAGQQVVLTSGQLEALYYPGRCTGRGAFGNTANAQGESADTGAETSLATDEAWLVCTGTPDIQIVKEISIDGGVTWYDGATPNQLPPSDASYRLTVTNTGNADLENVLVNDTTLGIVDYPVGGLLIGETVVLDEGDLSELFVANRCTEGGQYVNTASASGQSLDFPYGGVNDSDDATLVCQESYDICATGGRPNRLKMMYDGDDDISHQQGASAIIVPTVVNFPATPVTIEVYGKSLVATFTNVPVGGMFYVEDPSKSGKIPPTITIKIYDGNTLLQTITFHGSCSAPLNVGDDFGGAVIVGAEYY